MEAENNITIAELISAIWNRYGQNISDETMTDVDGVIAYGRRRGWLEEQDQLYKSFEADRRSVARIVHSFLKSEYGFIDNADWTRAGKLQDIYDCKVCANHVAQLVEAGIMPPKEINRFRLLDKVSYNEAESILSAMCRYTEG